MKRILAICLTSACLTSASLQAQQWQNYTSINETRAIASFNGAVWIGGSGGAVKFDKNGNLLNAYTVTDGLLSNDVYDILIDSNNVKWIATGAGISKYDGITWTSFTTDNGLPHPQIRSLALDLEGHLWCTLFSNTGFGKGVAKYDGDNWITYTVDSGLPDNTIWDIGVDSIGQVWFAGGIGGLGKYDGTSFTTYTKSNTGGGLPSDQIQCLGFDNKGHIWLSPQFGGVVRFDGISTWQPYTTANGLTHNLVFEIMGDAAGNIWFGTAYEGVSKFDGNTWATFKTPEGLTGNLVRDFAIDDNGTVWSCGTGMQKYTGQYWLGFTYARVIPSNDVQAVLVDSKQNKWIGMSGISDNLTKYDNESWVSYGYSSHLLLGGIEYIAEDPLGHIWLASGQGGIAMFNDTNWIQYTEQNSGLLSNVVAGIAIDRNNNKWIAHSASGLSKFDGAQWTTFTTIGGLGTDNAYCVFADNQDRIWVGTNSGVSMYDGVLWTDYTTGAGLPSNVVYAITQDANGELWFATGWGVGRYNGSNWTIYRTVDGLADNSVKSIAIASNGHVWCGTANGASKFDGAVWTSYHSRDGIGASLVQALAIDSMQTVWFGTNAGLTRRQDQHCVGHADFAMSVDTLSKTVTFINLSSGYTDHWYWTYGDGTFSNVQNPTHKYNQAGTYEVCLTAKETALVCEYTYCQKVKLGAQMFKARFLAKEGDVLNGIQFLDASTENAGKYHWDFGDGNTARGANPFHLFAMPGFYLVTLTVFNETSTIMDRYSQVIRVGKNQTDCESDFLYHVNLDNRQVSFRNQSLGEGLISYTWDFGDGKRSALEDPVHTYLHGKKYNVCLKASSSFCKNITCKQIKIDADTSDCTAGIWHMVDSLSNMVHFKEVTSYGADRWAWDFGDGNGSTERNPTHVYDTAGFYKVTLKVKKDEPDCLDFANALVSVNSGVQKLRCGFNYLHDTIYKTKGFFPTEFDGAEFGDPAEIEWDFGDGHTNTTTTSPVHFYEDTGTYTVCYTISDPIIEQTYSSCQQVVVSAADTLVQTIHSELFGADDIEVFPNPFHESITCMLPGSSGANMELALYDLLGQQILHQKCPPIFDQRQQLIINTGSIPNGVYYLRVSTRETTAIRKIMKL